MSSSSEYDSPFMESDEKLVQTLPIGDDSENYLHVTFSNRRSYTQWSPSAVGATLSWRDLNVYERCTKKRKVVYKRIINNVSGFIKAGSLVALMGASGAGKSTLMSALAYRAFGTTVVEGNILINGRPIGDYMRFLSAFMHQDDLFIGALTVLEHMNLMAHLKLDRRTSRHERTSKISDLLRQLSLTHCLDTKIGLTGAGKVLSGGEKKRLAFATELLTDPQFLFCDEPTTGLDSYSARKIVTIMNLMASSGKTIICTIHQPSSEVFAMFSQLLLLADSRIAFMGSSAEAIIFFRRLGYRCPNNYNPADFFIKTLATTPGAEEASKRAVKKICDHFAVSDYAKEVDVVVQYEFHMGRSTDVQTDFNFRSNVKDPFWWTKLYWLTYRCLLTVLRDTTIQVVRIIQKLAIAFLIGLCYKGTIGHDQNGIQAVQGAIFVFVSENTFNPMYSVLATFPADKPLFLREYHSGLYSVKLYYVSKVLSMIPGLIIEALLFTLVAYWFVGLNTSASAFFATALVVILTLMVATSCGIFFSNAFDTVSSAMTYLVPFDFVLLITSGLFLRLSSIPGYISWVKYLSWIMYSAESLSIVQWDGIHNITCESSNIDLPCIREGTEVLQKYNYSAENLLCDIVSMIVLCFTFHILGLICLWRKIRQ